MLAIIDVQVICRICVPFGRFGRMLRVGGSQRDGRDNVPQRSFPQPHPGTWTARSNAGKLGFERNSKLAHLQLGLTCAPPLTEPGLERLCASQIYGD